ncbi:MAG: GspE/PulE family protein [Defluviitaleaceae bacterium]|nr:GspE/PulE family protein [Defluviitaleaceae bacterium]
MNTDLAESLAENFNIQTRDLAEVTFDDFTRSETSSETSSKTGSKQLLDRETALNLLVLPLEQKGNRLWVAMADPLNHNKIADLYAITNLFIEPVFAEESAIRYFINQIYGATHIENIASQFLVEENIRNSQYMLTDETRQQISSAPTVKLVDSLIETAVINRASDIHIEPYENILRARFRIDGQLTNPQILTVSLHPNVISRLKVMGTMNISEKRMPQDGQFSLIIHGEPIEFRISTLPTIYGEKAVIRLLYGKNEQLNVAKLGFLPEDMPNIKRMFQNPQGAIIITGPTGSGKSTTLISFIAELNKIGVNIVTVEDPVENPLEGVNHVSIDNKTGFDFPNALRHILRQDPDIIMIGEIRDSETAEIASRASITGHLVLSTLHTNDAAGAFPRLVDMGIQPYMAAAALSGIIAQRLVRRLCPICKQQQQPTPQECKLLNISPTAKIFNPKGCNQCNNTGYKGRFAIYEYIAITENMRNQMAEQQYNLAKIEKILRADNDSILKNGIKNVILGNTSPTEVIRVVFRD